MHYSPTFLAGYDFVIRAEGNTSESIHDPGGVTKYGIAQRAHPELNIQALTRENARDIYYADYWTPIHGDQLDPSLAIPAFDCAVNQGVHASILMLQKALRLPVDGVIGPRTLAVAADVHDAEVAAFFTLRGLAYRASHNYKYFGRGWDHRLFACAIYVGRVTQNKEKTDELV